MIDITVSGNRWNIYINAMRQSEGSAIIIYPTKVRYSFGLGFGSAEQFADDLYQIQQIPDAGLRDLKLGRLSHEIEDAANSVKKISMKSYNQIKKAKLLDTYGAEDTLYNLIKEPMSELLEAVIKWDKEEIELLIDKYRGLMTEGKLADLSNIYPEDLKKILEEGNFTYKIKFLAINQRNWSFVSYYPAKKEVILEWNLYLPLLIDEDDKNRLVLDIKRVPESIKHELVHAFRDAKTKHIHKYIEKTRQPKAKEKQLEYYEERGHIELEFEIDAIINSISHLYERLKKEGINIQNLKFEDIEKYLGGFEFPEKDDPYFKVWIKRLHREGLLTDAMKSEIGVSGTIKKRSYKQIKNEIRYF